MLKPVANLRFRWLTRKRAMHSRGALKVAKHIAVAVLVSSFTPHNTFAEEASVTPTTVQATPAKLQPFRELTATYCIDCHSGPEAEARLDIDSLTTSPFGKYFSDWRRVERVLADRSMPPADADQPTNAELTTAKHSLDGALNYAIQKAAADPGPSLLRRITNAEYEYCIEDLTGVRMNLRKLLISDSVGGSGFTNSATGQFMNDATLERYLETAKLVADHAMIGAGPLYFHKDPGLTGLELSAVDRIQSIYRAFGFRASAGEGAKPYGLERFPTAFHVTWQYRFKKQLGLKSSMDDLARTAGISGKFARHIWNVMHRREPTFPISRIVESWHGFPSPDRIDGNHEIVIGEKSQALFEELQKWQKRLADAAGQEEAALLSGRKVEILNSTKFKARAMRKRRKLSPGEAPDLNDPNNYERDGRVRIEIRVERASDDIGTKPAVVFSNSQFRFDLFDGTDLDPVPLKTLLPESENHKLNFGFNSDGEPISADEFAIHVGQRETIEILLPDDVRYGELKLVATVDSKSGRDAVVRCTITDVTAEFDPQLGLGSKEYSALLRDTNSSRMDEWETGLADFAKALPQISHREPTPSDRDPISPLYEQKYNLPERNYFHTAVKYYRDDGFLTKHVLPSNQLATLDQAWTDLLTSFNYHNVNLRFAAKKHDIDLHDSDIQTDSHVWIDKFPTEVQPVLAEQKRQYDAMQQSLKAAEPQHLSDVATFAAKAWRRPLREHEITELDAFYHQQRMDRQLTHREAIRALLVRILVSPDFLYRLEQTPNSHRAVTLPPIETESQAPKPLSTHELASRLSFSIWSSIPDDELLETAHNGTLKDAKVLKSQLVRLLKSPKSRRLATEFFGQWFGFYNFDDFRGVDAKRFPEFDDRLKRSLHDEAISFFEYLIREDRPYTEIVQANYTFLDARSANHYGITLENTDRDTKLANAEYAMDYRDRASSDQVRKVDVSKHQRGGLLGLGAILTSTSAPLRTSPVKRGDWILRRLIGTPVPPPPADAGSIPHRTTHLF